jgi:hypothetical protein
MTSIDASDRAAFSATRSLRAPQDARSVPRTLQSLGRRYVRFVNDTYRRTGTLWEGRYRAHAHGAADPLAQEHELFRRLGKTASDRQSAYRAPVRAALDPELIAALRSATSAPANRSASAEPTAGRRSGGAGPLPALADRSTVTHENGVRRGKIGQHRSAWPPARPNATRGQGVARRFEGSPAPSGSVSRDGAQAGRPKRSIRRYLPVKKEAASYRELEPEREFGFTAPRGSWSARIP